MDVLTVFRKSGWSLYGFGGWKGLYDGSCGGGKGRRCCHGSSSPPSCPREAHKTGPYPHYCLTHRQLVHAETQHRKLEKLQKDHELKENDKNNLHY